MLSHPRSTEDRNVPLNERANSVDMGVALETGPPRIAANHRSGISKVNFVSTGVDVTDRTPS
jgi:hypothetical protein